MKWHAPALVLALAAFGIVCPAPCDAAEARPTIAILCVANDPFGQRVAAELRELGFEPVLLDPQGAPASRASLEAAGRSVGAIAAVRAVPSERGVEVWLADRVTGKTLLREMRETGVDADRALALQTVELLRASLLEVSLPEAPKGEVRATAAVSERLELPPLAAAGSPAAPAFRVSFASALVMSAGGLDAAPSLVPGLDWMFSEHAGLSLLASLPLASARVERPEGTATLTTWMVGGALRLSLAPRERRWVPCVELGVLGMSLEGSGSPGAGFESRTASSAAVAPFLRVGLAFALTPRLRLRADGAVGGVAQEVSLRIANQEAATWGSPFAFPSLGIDYGWF